MGARFFSTVVPLLGHYSQVYGPYGLEASFRSFSSSVPSKGNMGPEPPRSPPGVSSPPYLLLVKPPLTPLVDGLRLGRVGRGAAGAKGTSDRFVLKFVKP